MTALTSFSNSTGSTITLRGIRRRQPRLDLADAGRDVLDQDHLRLRGALADQALAELERAFGRAVAGIGVAGELAQARTLACARRSRRRTSGPAAR